MQGKSFEIRYGWKSALLGLLGIAMGIGAIAGAPGLARMECHGRNAWFCELLLNLPETGRIIFWGLSGLFFLLGATIILYRVLKAVPAVRLDRNGISFHQGSSVFVPWAEVASLSLSRRWMELKVEHPVEIRLFAVWPRHRSKFAIPYSGGRAYVDGKRMSGSARDAFGEWLDGMKPGIPVS